MITIPMKTVSALNAREHWRTKAGRVKRERKTVAGYLLTVKKPKLPCSVLLTRIACSSGLDDDNLVSSMKSVRDQIAQWLGVDDRDNVTVRYRYQQRRGEPKKPAVIIEFGEPVKGAQLTLPVEIEECHVPF